MGTAGEHCDHLSFILLLRIANGGEGASGTQLARSNYHLPPWLLSVTRTSLLSSPTKQGLSVVQVCEYAGYVRGLSADVNEYRSVSVHRTHQ
jgi:hypothetical protein